MSSDETKKERLKPHSLDLLLNPGKAMELKVKADADRQKELVELKKQVELSTMSKPSLKETKQGTGGLKKEEVIAADGKPSVNQMQQAEKQQAQAQRNVGTTEQHRKTA
jgi:hypothetical protein